MKFEVTLGKILEDSCDLLVLSAIAATKKADDTQSNEDLENALLPLYGLLKEVNTALHGLLAEAIVEEGFHGAKGETLLFHTQRLLPAKRILLVGIGTRKEVSADRFRDLGAFAVQHGYKVQAKRVHVSCDTFGNVRPYGPYDCGQAVAEGALLAEYHFTKYQKKKQKEAEKRQIFFMRLYPKTSAQRLSMQNGIVQGEQASRATMMARDLVNEPGLVMKPYTLVQHAQQLAKTAGISCEILNEEQAAKLGMGSFLSVARGSDEEGYIIHLTYRPAAAAKAKKFKKLVLCGKGITFDSGGLSLKPPAYMFNMKADMAAAAAILGLFSVIADLKPKPQWEVHGVIVTTENMPSGKASRPGDVVTAYNGKTIEILNTDAEGRLVLADALAWAEATIQPDVMMDLATLTGAAIVALGQQVAAVFGTDAQWIKRYMRAAAESGERVWQLPLVDEYRKLIDSQIADVQNIARIRGGDAIIGALFLAEFVKKTPWVHVDIAGPAWVDKPEQPFIPYGASGYGVRTLIQLLKNLS